MSLGSILTNSSPYGDEDDNSRKPKRIIALNTKRTHLDYKNAPSGDPLQFFERCEERGMFKCILSSCGNTIVPSKQGYMNLTNHN